MPLWGEGSPEQYPKTNCRSYSSLYTGVPQMCHLQDPGRHGECVSVNCATSTLKYTLFLPHFPLVYQMASNMRNN